MARSNRAPTHAPRDTDAGFHRRTGLEEATEGEEDFLDFDELLDDYCARVADDPPRPSSTRRKRAG